MSAQTKKTGDNMDENLTSIDQLDEDEMRTYCEDMEGHLQDANNERSRLRRSMQRELDNLKQGMDEVTDHSNKSEYPQATGCAKAIILCSINALTIALK